MSARSLFQLFLGLNLALTGAVAVCLALSPGQAPGPPAPVEPLTGAARLGSAPSEEGRAWTWRDVESAGYVDYLGRLRAAGCPEERVRMILLADAAELSAQRRLAIAVAHDAEWWRADPATIAMDVLQSLDRDVQELRQELLVRLLGADAPETRAAESGYWSTVPMSGMVLGRLEPRRHCQVQEVCRRSMDRQGSLFAARIAQGQLPSEVELARLRLDTRAELARVLETTELEEFLLRYSRNGIQLRMELRNFGPSAEEFRKIFAALDPIDLQMQLEFGSVESMSPGQCRRWQSQREAAVRQVLSAERYQAYVRSRGTA